MNKTVLITIAVIVGLLALWLIVILFYPKGEETTNQNTAPVNGTTNVTEAGGAASGTVTATVQIVESLDDIEAQTEATNAEVTITE